MENDELVIELFLCLKDIFELLCLCLCSRKADKDKALDPFILILRILRNKRWLDLGVTFLLQFFNQLVNYGITDEFSSCDTFFDLLFSFLFRPIAW